MGIKNYCLAVSLPVIAFLTFYFFKQKKITNNICKKDDNKITNQDDLIKNNQINKSGDKSFNNFEDNQNDQSKIKKSILNQKNDNQSTNEKNQSIDEIININNNNNDFKSKLDQDRDISYVIENNSIKEDEKNLIKEDEKSFINDQLIHQLANEENSIDNNRKVSKLIEKFNNETINRFSKNESINQSLNQSKNESVESLNQTKNESVASVRLKATKINEEELNDNSQNKSINQSKIINQKSNSLEEGEEIFETNNDKSIDTVNDTINLSNCNLTSIDESTQQFTENSTNLTFDTACDSSSLNATINTLLDQNAFNSFNYSNQTLLSNDDNCAKGEIENLNEQKPNDNLNNDNNKIKINESKEEVKEDLNLIEETTSTTANKTITENILNNSQILDSSTLNNSTTSLTKDDVNFEKQIIYEQNDIVSKNNDEKFLNVTEAEFKNDSKLEIANEILEDLKTKIENEQNNLEKKDYNESKEDSSLINEDLLNKSEDDSICIIYDGNENKVENCKSKAIENQIKPKEEIKTNGTTNIVNLDESDLEIVFESTKPITTQTNGHSNNKKILNDKKLMNQKSNENDQILDYCFEIAQALTGLLVGTKGSFINQTMTKSNTKIKVISHPTVVNLNLCLIQGTKKNIDDALKIIRQRFPIRKFPQLTLDQIDSNIISIEPIPQTSQLSLPEGVSIEVGVSQIMSPSHVFLHQITHPTFNLLQNLDRLMISTYQNKETPHLDDQLTIGVIAAVEHDGGWYRAMVIDINQENCTVKLLDYGGLLTVNKNSLRQVRRDFMTLQFQACEAILSNIEPKDGKWSIESIDFFKKIAQKQILQSFTIGYTENGIPKIHLIRIEDNTAILINRELVDKNYAIWVD